jgi:hypothetical protein
MTFSPATNSRKSATIDRPQPGGSRRAGSLADRPNNKKENFILYYIVSVPIKTRMIYLVPAANKAAAIEAVKTCHLSAEPCGLSDGCHYFWSQATATPDTSR